jgi:multidrug efflux pump subunit AcrB
VLRIETVFEDEIVYRRDRKRTLTILADPVEGVASKLFDRLRPKDRGDPTAKWKLEWGGEYEDSNRAKSALASKLPVFLILMVLTTIALFNNLRQPLVIWLRVIFGLMCATVLTMVVLPVIYAILYKLPYRREDTRSHPGRDVTPVSPARASRLRFLSFPRFLRHCCNNTLV